MSARAASTRTPFTCQSHEYSLSVSSGQFRESRRLLSHHCLHLSGCAAIFCSSCLVARFQDQFVSRGRYKVVLGVLVYILLLQVRQEESQRASWCR